ncbi:hypothetical protein KI387_038617, partial [Taxus chinensis]
DRHPEQGGGYRTAALLRAAVTRPPPRQGGGFVTEEQKAKKRGEKRKTKHAGAKRGMRDDNAYLERFFPDPEHLARRPVSSLGYVLRCSDGAIPFNFG